jgi:hypothetical protein
MKPAVAITRRRKHRTHRVITRQAVSNLRLAYDSIGVHLTHHVLRRTPGVPRPATLHHAVLREAPIARRRVRAWRRRRGIVKPLTHDDELGERAGRGHRRLGEGGGRGIWVHR